MARIHYLEEEVDRMKTFLSKAISADLEKIRPDMAASRASPEKEYQQEVTSLCEVEVPGVTTRVDPGPSRR